MDSRVGKIYIIDDIPHICIEDNGDRGIFQVTGEHFQNWAIKPTMVALFCEIKIRSGDEYISYY